MEFVDRIEESKRLTKALSGKIPSFIVIYGRRRLGKSTLIKRVLSDRDVYFLADLSEASHQRTLLAKIISEAIPGFDSVEYPDWETLLKSVNYRTDEKFTLCLDEFPYLVKQAPELPSVLQRLLDEKILKYNLLICGSSQNMMYGLVLDSSAPLYGRADVILKFQPIRLPYMSEALGLLPVDTIEEYSIWGGVPRYWELREKANSLKDSVWENILSTNGTLYEEPAKLFQDDISDIVKTATIMSYVGSGANRLSEIAARCNEPATNLSRPLKKLIDLGFLEKEVPFGVDEKDSKKSLYKIADPFMAFYYRFVVPYRSFIELDRRTPIEQVLNTQFSDYVGNHWEKLCRQAVTGNEINGILYGKASRWWGSVHNQQNKSMQIEFDVMAKSMDNKYLLVGECKWTLQEDAQILTDKLVQKAKLLPFAKDYIIVPVLFLKNIPNNNGNNTLLPKDIIALLS